MIITKKKKKKSINKDTNGDVLHKTKKYCFINIRNY